MNPRYLRPANMAAATALICGVLVVAMPQHALSILRLGIVTAAAAACLFALVVNAPPTWWLSPFDRSGRRRRGRGSGGDVAWIRSRLGGRRQRIAGGRPLPAGTVQLLQPLIESALERQGIDPADRASLASAGRLVSPTTLAVLRAGERRGRWFRTVRPDRRGTAEAVHAVLDDLDRLRAGGAASHEKAEAVHAVPDDFDRLRAGGAASPENPDHREWRAP
jgi:hypothetical protein